MTDRCTIERPTGAFSDPDPDSGAVTALYTPLMADYPMRLRSFESYERRGEVGGHEATIQRTAARFPVSGAYIPRPGDRVTITSSRSPAFAVTPNRVFLIADAPQNTHATAYRVYVDEVTA